MDKLDEINPESKLEKVIYFVYKFDNLFFESNFIKL